VYILKKYKYIYIFLVYIPLLTIDIIFKLLHKRLKYASKLFMTVFIHCSTSILLLPMLKFSNGTFY
ncbi:hypothetical protein, partial [Borreliella garinii]|uniref:hypothetical protein n=1 Tax=Borreliella garinii TaxID=29519 RepID=UPI001AEF8586